MKENLQFIMMYPLTAIIGLIFIILFGGITLPFIIKALINPLILIPSIAVGLIFKPTKGIVVWATIIGGLNWIITLLLEMSDRVWFCNIPILGQIVCGIYDIFVFIPRILNLVSMIFVAIIIISLVSFIRKEIKK